MEPLKPKISDFNQKKPGNFKANAPCKKHPKHRQSPGVCSICLREKLSQVSNTSTSKVSTSLSSSSSSSYVSSLSSSNVSSYSSPAVNLNSKCRKDLEARKPIRVFKNVGQNVLKKSRSMAFVLQRRKEEASMDENKGKNTDTGQGFWSKLLTRRNKGLMHSRAMRERVTTEVQ